MLKKKKPRPEWLVCDDGVMQVSLHDADVRWMIRRDGEKPFTLDMNCESIPTLIVFLTRAFKRYHLDGDEGSGA